MIDLVNDFPQPLPPPNKPADAWSVSETCRFAARFYSGVYNAIGLSVLRDFGAARDGERAVHWMHTHQRARFLEGCRKLGIDDEPDAVRCAKYHALSNALAGIRITYAVESARKAWLFYHPETGSVGTAVLEDTRMLSTFKGWHANNSVLLENPGLVFVATHLLSRGDPYDAGYFLDSGEDVAADDRLRLAFEEQLPAEVEMLLPRIDPEVWPEERRVRAMRNVKVGWACDSAATAVDLLGVAGAASVRHGVETTLYGWLPLLTAAFGGGDERPGARVARIFAGVHAIAGSSWSASSEPIDGGTRVRLGRDLLSEASASLGPDRSQAAYAALADAWSGLARALGARVAMVGTGDAWDFTDAR